LPVAQRCEEIEEQDFAVLVQIAENPEAPAGRLKRVPQKMALMLNDEVLLRMLGGAK
jgi:hypothetical protein